MLTSAQIIFHYYTGLQKIGKNLLECLLRLPSLWDHNILANDNTIATKEKINEDITSGSNCLYLL